MLNPKSNERVLSIPLDAILATIGYNFYLDWVLGFNRSPPVSIGGVHTRARIYGRQNNPPKLTLIEKIPGKSHRQRVLARLRSLAGWLALIH